MPSPMEAFSQLKLPALPATLKLVSKLTGNQPVYHHRTQNKSQLAAESWLLTAQKRGHPRPLLCWTASWGPSAVFSSSHTTH